MRSNRFSTSRATVPGVRPVALTLVVALTLAGCASVQRSDSTLPPLGTLPGITAPTPTIAQVDVTAPTPDTVAVVTPSRALSDGDVPKDAECAVGDLPGQGQVTFAYGKRIYALNPDASIICLAKVQQTPTWLSWSPDGDEVLIAPNAVLRNDGTVADTGFFETNYEETWSQPTGKALLAPKASTGQLIWRNAHNSGDRLDITFANGTTAAAYHPSGTSIASSGTGVSDGAQGIFLATNRGENAQRLGTLESGTKATELAFDMSGGSLVFVHAHSDGSGHVHRYVIGSGDLVTLAERPDVVPTDLTVSTVDEGDVAWAENRSTASSQVYASVGLDATDPVPVSLPAETIGTPLGWLPGHRLLIAVRPVGTPKDDPYDVWLWTPAGASLLISGVTQAGARAPHGPWNPLPGVPASGFG